jgi:hypothetical protein
MIGEVGEADVPKMIEAIIYANKKDEKKFVVNCLPGKNG